MSANGTKASKKDPKGTMPRGIIAAAVVLALVAGISIAYITTLGGGSDAPDEAAPIKVGKPAQLTMFALQSDPSYVAIVGTRNEGATSVLALPPNVLTALPDVGSGTLASAVAESGGMGRMAASNVLGTWIPHYALVDEAGLAELVQRRGSLTVNLPPRVTLGGQAVGPGPTELTPEQVVEYLRVHKGSEQVLRWEEVLRPLLAEPVDLNQEVVVATDDMDAVGEAGAKAHDATVTTLEADTIEGGLQMVGPQVVRTAMAGSFGVVHGDPTRVIVLEGAGESVAEDVTNALIPAGYQISAYGDARGKNHDTTIVYASMKAAVPHAEAIAEALGVGRVMMSRSVSGLGDVTVLVGKDFLQG